MPCIAERRRDVTRVQRCLTRSLWGGPNAYLSKVRCASCPAHSREKNQPSLGPNPGGCGQKSFGAGGNAFRSERNSLAHGRHSAAFGRQSSRHASLFLCFARNQIENGPLSHRRGCHPPCGETSSRASRASSIHSAPNTRACPSKLSLGAQRSRAFARTAAGGGEILIRWAMISARCALISLRNARESLACGLDSISAVTLSARPRRQRVSCRRRTRVPR